MPTNQKLKTPIREFSKSRIILIIYGRIDFLMGKKQMRQRKPNMPTYNRLITGSVFEGSFEIKIPSAILQSFGVVNWWPSVSPTKGGRNTSTILFKGKDGGKDRSFDVELTIQDRTKQKMGIQYRIRETSGDGPIQDLFRRIFVASYIRHLEAQHRNSVGLGYDQTDVEEFFEFLVIEFDLKNQQMIWYADYTVTPTYAHVFNKLAENRFLHQLDLKLKNKNKFPHTEWKEYSINGKLNKPSAFTKNVIYFLRDDNNKTLYIGKGGSGRTAGTDRIFQKHPKTMPTPTHYRYDVLPSHLDDATLRAIEEMQIRAFAFLLDNSPTVKSQKRKNVKGFSTYKLTNREIKN